MYKHIGEGMNMTPEGTTYAARAAQGAFSESHIWAQGNHDASPEGRAAKVQHTPTHAHTHTHTLTHSLTHTHTHTHAHTHTHTHTHTPTPSLHHSPQPQNPTPK